MDGGKTSKRLLRAAGKGTGGKRSASVGKQLARAAGESTGANQLEISCKIRQAIVFKGG